MSVDPRSAAALPGPALKQTFQWPPAGLLVGELDDAVGALARPERPGVRRQGQRRRGGSPDEQGESPPFHARRIEHELA